MITASSPLDSRDHFNASAYGRSPEQAYSVDEVAAKATGDIVQKVDELAAQAGNAIGFFGQTIADLLPQTGVMGQASQSVAKSLQQVGHNLETNKFSGASASVENLVRRYPYETIVAGIVTGYLCARFLRK